MIKVKECYSDFIKHINIGTRAYFMVLDKNGYQENLEDCSNAAASFANVVITGEDPLYQMQELATFLKEVQKLNPSTTVYLEIDGTKKPTYMSSLKNVQYIIRTKLKNIKLPYEERVNDLAWKWLGKAGAKFIFDVDTKDDFDEILTITNALFIKKEQVYINIRTNVFDKFAFITQTYGFNLYIKYEGEWYEHNRQEKQEN